METLAAGPCRRRAQHRLLLVVAALVAIGACNKNPTGPSDTPTGVAKSIAVTGSTSLTYPGATSQWSATASFSDGTTKDITGVADWSSSRSVVTVARGLLTAVAYGTSTISVQYQTKRQSIDVRVAPEGMPLVSGQVSAGTYPLSDAHVEAVSSNGTWTTTTDLYGFYAVPATGSATIRVTKAGYQAETRQLAVARDEQLDLDLRPTDTPQSLRGDYVVTFSASPGCTLPAPAARRTWSARLEEGRFINRPEDLVVTLTGGAFIGWANEPGFTGRTDGHSVTFNVTDDMDSDFAVIERIDGGDLSFSGTANGVTGASTFATVFNGKVTLREGSSTKAECQATDHRLEFARK